MIRLPKLPDVLWLHSRIIADSGGSAGLRDLGALKSALAQPSMTFGERDLYPTLLEKCAALAFSLVNNHPFVDGNKRVAHAVLEVTLNLNGLEIAASVDVQERLMLGLASGELGRTDLGDWLVEYTKEST